MISTGQAGIANLAPLITATEEELARLIPTKRKFASECEDPEKGSKLPVNPPPSENKTTLFFNLAFRCKGNYYGRQCELDGEVVAVAIGASVAAVVIIILTLTCLCLWSRRWKREHQKAEMMMSFPPYILPGETSRVQCVSSPTGSSQCWTVG